MFESGGSDGTRTRGLWRDRHDFTMFYKVLIALYGVFWAMIIGLGSQKPTTNYNRFKPWLCAS
jgi:hypothetical protein